jgi:diketogulonate reductase-like aldo/keto reductase
MSETPSVTLPSGARMPAFGLGTWRMGNDRSRRKQETDAIAHAIDIGYPMIDTAEMYGEGNAEESIGDALAGRKRDAIYLVSKVYPHNASKTGTVAACERSLKRLKTDRIDLYLLHWRGQHAFADTLEGFERLLRDGKIKDYGVSNFDRDDMEEWTALDGGRCGTNQVMYNLARRGIEFDLVPWQRQHTIPVMAYSPLDQGPLLRHATLKAIAARHGATPAQIALAWLLRQEAMVAIPKSADRARVSENLGALKVKLTDADITELDRAFPPPKRKTSLAMS